jgi:recombination protein RecT
MSNLIKKNITEIKAQIEEVEQQLLVRKQDFENVLPHKEMFEKFVRVVKTAIIQNHDLIDADRATLLMACLKCAQDGLLPDGKEAALIIYNTKKDNVYIKNAQYIPMVRGLLKKIYQSGKIINLSSNVVYTKDEFVYEAGDDAKIYHRPWLLNDRGAPYAVYAIAKTKDSIYRKVMTITEIEKVRSYSKAKDGYKSPWVEWWDEMAKKTVIRSLFKELPVGSEEWEIVQREDELYEFNNDNSNTSASVNEDVEKLNHLNS